MLQLLPQKNKILTPNTTNPQDAIKLINSYIEKHQCESMSVDISFMNIIDASYVSTLCSTTHYIKYPSGKISWKISSNLVSELNQELKLGNAEYLL